MKTVSCSMAAALVLAATATALGQPPMIDGTRDASYGSALWVNTTNPTGFGDNAPGLIACSSFGSGMQLAINNSNIAGVPGGGPAGCVSSGAAVMTGVEIKLPFAAINNPTQATFTISGFIIGQNHDFVSNQIIGGTTGPCPANLAEVRNLILDDTVVGGLPGNQFVTVTNGADTDAVGPTIDGTLDAALYGAPLWINTTETGFGDNNLGNAGLANGSELGAIYARVLTVGAEKSLFIFLTGNLEGGTSTYNKVWVFLDCVAGQGQHRMLGNNANLDFNGLNRLGESPAGAGNGLTFDTGVEPDYALTCTNGGTPITTYSNFGELLTAGAGQGRYVGSAVNPAPIIVTPCVPTPLPVPSPDKAYGSELNNAYGVVCDNYLHLFLGGNLEVNGNKLEVFFDVDSATTNEGQQTIRADNVTVGFGALGRMGLGAEGPGITFDSGFKADYWVTFRNEGAGVADPVFVGSEAAFLRSGGANGDVLDIQGLLDYGSFTAGPKAANNPLSFNGTFCIRPVTLAGLDGMIGTGDDVFNVCAPNGSYVAPLPNVEPLSGTTWNPVPINPGIDVQGDNAATANNLVPIADIFSSYAPRLISTNAFDPLGRVSPNPNLTIPGLIQVTIDNNNIAGVTDTTTAGSDLVTTGFEMRIRIDELGWDGVSPIRVVAFINGASHDFVSNQVVGGLTAGAANLGEPRMVNFDDTTAGVAGNQFITIPVGDCVPVVLTGACCCGANCIVTTAAACPSIVGSTGQVFAGVGTACAPLSRNVPCCRGDFNKSGGNPSVQDIFDFLAAYFGTAGGGPGCADANDSGGTSVQDIFDFLAFYFAGAC